MGCVSDGTTMTVFPTASAGATKETKPSNGNSSVLAIAMGDLAQHPAIGSEDLATIPLVGARLLAADEELVGAVDGRDGAGTRKWELGTRNGHGWLVPRSNFRVPRFQFRFQILPH